MPPQFARTKPNRSIAFVSALVVVLGISTSVIRQSINANAETNGRAWMKDAKYGLFFHYIHSSQQLKDLNWVEAIKSFDVETFTDEVVSTGADYVMFTLGQNDGYWVAPNKTYEERVGKRLSEGRFPDRDLPKLISESLKRKSPSTKFFLYFTSEGPGKDLEQSSALGWDGQKWNSTFSQNWQAIAKEWSDRYKTSVDGWWIDGSWLKNIPFADFAATLRSGNPNAVVSFNPGSQQEVSLKCFAGSVGDDYMAGERNEFDQLPKPNEPIVCGGDKKPWHVLSFLGKSWGDPNAMYTSRFLTDYIKTANAVEGNHGIVTFDASLSSSGRIAPEQLKLLQDINAGMRSGAKASGPEGTVNVALNKPASSSGSYPNYEPRFANDGRIANDEGWAASPNGPASWTVDLGQNTTVTNVDILTRQKGWFFPELGVCDGTNPNPCPKPATNSNLVVELSNNKDFSGEVFTAAVASITPRGAWEVDVDDKPYRYLRVSRSDDLSGELFLLEVRAWGYDEQNRGPVTIAPTTATSTTATSTAVAPSTVTPTTYAPTTEPPPTQPPTTIATTMVAPTTAAPTTIAPVTTVPTTANPPTAAPTTAAPATTATPPTTTPRTSTATKGKPRVVQPELPNRKCELNADALYCTDGFDRSLLATGVTKFSYSTNRVCVLNASVSCKEGPLDANWVEMTDKTDAVFVSDSRVCVTRVRTLFCKQGTLSARWLLIHDDTIDLVLTDDNLCITNSADEQWCKVNGQLDDPWEGRS